jgi:hypothetical protein
VRRFAYLLFFLALVEEGRSTYSDYVFAPFKWAHVLIEPIAKVRPLDVMLGVILVVAKMGSGSKLPTTRPMARALLAVLGVTVFALLHGLATGGDARAAGWQMYLPLAMVLASFAFGAVMKSAEDYLGLLRVILAAGVCHAVMCIVFHFLYIRPGLVSPLPEYEATHDDTILWTVGVGFLLVQSLLTPSARNRLLAAVLIPLLLTAIQFNRRRLAWVSLTGILVTMYFLMPPSAARRRVNRIAAVIVPLVLVYVAVGWGRTEGIFRPLRSFQTVSTEQDASTLARNVENLGLIATAKQGWLLGTGWGHGYVEISAKYQIHSFELWPYVPHNSVLGLFAYTGYLGFVGYWMMFPVAAFFHARLARHAGRPVERLVGMVGLMQIVACADQWYGDMGAFSAVTTYTLASSLAGALRLPIAAGVWAGHKPLARAHAVRFRAA